MFRSSRTAGDPDVSQLSHPFCQKAEAWDKRYEFIWALDSDIDISRADASLEFRMERNRSEIGLGPLGARVSLTPTPDLQIYHSQLMDCSSHHPFLWVQWQPLLQTPKDLTYLDHATNWHGAAPSSVVRGSACCGAPVVSAGPRGPVTVLRDRSGARLLETWRKGRGSEGEERWAYSAWGLSYQKNCRSGSTRTSLF